MSMGVVLVDSVALRRSQSLDETQQGFSLTASKLDHMS